MASWIKLPSVTVQNGSNTVAVTGGYDLSKIEAGWSFDVGSNRAEINSGTAPDGSGNSTITLVDPWDGADVTAQPAKIVPIAGGEIVVIKQLTETNDFAVTVHQSLQEYAAEDKDVTLTLPDGSESTFASLPKIDRLFQAMVDSQGTAAGYDVTESATDLTSNRLLKYADFGLGKWRNLVCCKAVTSGTPTKQTLITTKIPKNGTAGVVSLRIRISESDYGRSLDIQTGAYVYNSGVFANYYAIIHGSETNPVPEVRYGWNDEGFLEIHITHGSGTIYYPHVLVERCGHEVGLYDSIAASLFQNWQVSFGTPLPAWASSVTAKNLVTYSTRNILGMVSQYAGVPTGAIIERGSNVNGEYTKFADGTMICAKQDSTATSNPYTWTFPSSFSDLPAILIGVDRSSYASIATKSNVTNNSSDITLRTVNNSLDSSGFSAIATGRWY